MVESHLMMMIDDRWWWKGNPISTHSVCDELRRMAHGHGAVHRTDFVRNNYILFPSHVWHARAHDTNVMRYNLKLKTIANESYFSFITVVHVDTIFSARMIKMNRRNSWSGNNKWPNERRWYFFLSFFFFSFSFNYNLVQYAFLWFPRKLKIAHKLNIRKSQNNEFEQQQQQQRNEFLQNENFTSIPIDEQERESEWWFKKLKKKRKMSLVCVCVRVSIGYTVYFYPVIAPY